MNKKESLYTTFFKEKNCIITGSSSGIGRKLALSLASYGCNILLVARREELLREVVSECRKQSGAEACIIDYCAIDISNLSNANKVIDMVQDKLGTVDILIANAGASMHDSIENTSEQVFHQMMRANFYVAVNIVKSALSMLREQKGTIAAVSSIQSLIGVPQHAAYVAAKHALGGFLETLEMEEDAISVVEVLTGWVSGTDIRNSAIDGKGNVVETRNTHQRHSRSSITVDECVEAIIEGIYQRKRLVFRPQFWKNILFVKYSMRKYLHNLIKTRQSFSSS